MKLLFWQRPNKPSGKGRSSQASGRHRAGGKKTSSGRSSRAMSSRKANPPDMWWERWLWYAHPKRFKDWWFTRPGMMAALRIAGVAAGLMLIFIISLFLYFARELPSPGQINARLLEQTTRFYDRTGEHILYEVYGDQNRTYIDLEDMGEYVASATISIEDRNFYNRGAFSSLGILRAAIYNVLSLGEGGLQGGSTITQQYVKNALLTPEQTLSRKIKELILSMQIEQLYDKDDILELYLNEIGYGAQAYGVQAASQMFFSKDAEELTLDEAAMLAALPQAPTYYSPYGQNTADLEARMHTVLNLMARQGYITQEEADEAIAINTLSKVNDTPDAYRNIIAPHFVLSVQEELEEQYGTQEILQGGLQIITTIDLDLQEKAEQAVKDGMDSVENGGGNNAALVASDPDTGQVLAMVGSRDFGHPRFGAYNAAMAHRQPGSSFKPYVYAQGFESNDWGAGSVIYDVRTDFGNYVPNNFDNSFRGIMTIRSALAESRNIPAVKMLYIVGLQNTLDKVRELGITTLGDASNYGLSLVLGSGEVRLDQHVNAYESFANGGIHHEQTKILKITDSKGTVIEEWKESEGERVWDEQVAYLMSHILSDDGARAATFGFNSANFAVPGHNVAIKTGTTDDLRDGWMMGYSRCLAAGTWVGHNQNEPMHVATSNMNGPIFTQFMRAALEGRDCGSFEQPAGIQTVRLDQHAGTIATRNSRNTVTDIFPSWYIPSEARSGESATINTASNRRVNDNCMPLDRYVEEVSNVSMQAEIPPEDPAFSRWDPPVQALARSMNLSRRGNIPDRTDNCSQRPRIQQEPSSATWDENEEAIFVEVKVQGSTDEVALRYNNQPVPEDGVSEDTYRFRYDNPSGPGTYVFEAQAVNNGLYDTASISCDNCDDIPPAQAGMGPPIFILPNNSFLNPVLFWHWLLS